MSDTEGDRMQRPRRSTAPRSLDALAEIFQAPITDPREGEIWRAAWHTCVLLVVVTEVEDNDIDAVPISPDLDLGDDHTIRIEPGPPLVHPVGAWRELSERLPMRVLDTRIGALSARDLDRLRNEPGDGAPITSPLDERHQIQASLSARMTELSAASWVPSRSEPVDLRQRIRDQGLDPSALAAELGATPGDVMDFVRGDRTPSPEQAAVLAPLLDLAVDQLLSVSLDDNLVWALDRPQFRKPLAQRGRDAGFDDEAVWRLQVATTELPVAARTTGTNDPRRRWMGLIQNYLDER